mmetsp:Transcript_80943/g.182635  ORF Transcript_80943/g.182635 Transcript_80943/m.182635 type:complete len:124 (+) Transcript_80943:107-478(+)
MAPLRRSSSLLAMICVASMALLLGLTMGGTFLSTSGQGAFACGVAQQQHSTSAASWGASARQELPTRAQSSLLRKAITNTPLDDWEERCVRFCDSKCKIASERNACKDRCETRDMSRPYTDSC